MELIEVIGRGTTFETKKFRTTNISTLQKLN